MIAEGKQSLTVPPERPEMPRDGAIIFGDLIGKLDVLPQRLKMKH